jgi:hypothetical protein
MASLQPFDKFSQLTYHYRAYSEFRSKPGNEIFFIYYHQLNKQPIT